MNVSRITFDHLTECFSLDVEAGDIYWKVRPRHHFISDRSANAFNTKYAGAKAGSLRKIQRRRSVMLFKRPVMIYRVIYALVHNLDLDDLPPIIDHVDGDPLNDRPGNLRPATARQNAQNSAFRKNNKSGYRGVVLDARCGSWVAKIKVNGKDKNLGSFRTKEEASACFIMAAKKLHGEFYRENAVAR